VHNRITPDEDYLKHPALGTVVTLSAVAHAR
jgi:hypothetical protein